jgi:predicted nucleotidyltransferase
MDEGQRGCLAILKKRTSALDAADARRISVRVAGPTALLVAKLHKLADRRNTGRHDDKDALDVYRLLQAVPTAQFVSMFDRLLSEPVSAKVTESALALLAELFGEIDADGCQMAARAVELIDDPETIAASCAALTQELLGALEESRP